MYFSDYLFVGFIEDLGIETCHYSHWSKIIDRGWCVSVCIVCLLVHVHESSVLMPNIILFSSIECWFPNFRHVNFEHTHHTHARTEMVTTAMTDKNKG
jgi:hypothetical protein